MGILIRGFKDFKSKEKGVKTLANCQKYKVGAVGGLGRHFEREPEKDGKLVRHSNQDIDLSRTHLNYNLAPDRGLTHSGFVSKRCSEVDFVGRKNTNVMCVWVVTAPKELEEEEYKRFFEETYRFLNGRYGEGKEKNVISSWVHMDETTPHMHYAFVPVVWDGKRGNYKVSAKEVINRQDLQSFHKDFSGHMERVFGRDIGVHNEVTQGNNRNKEQLEAERLARLEVEKLAEENRELAEENRKIRLEQEQLKSEQEKLKAQNNEIRIENDKIKIENTEIDFEVSQSENRAKELQGGIKLLEGQRNELEGRLNAIEVQIQNEVSKLENLRAEISVLNNGMDALNNEMNTLSISKSDIILKSTRAYQSLQELQNNIKLLEEQRNEIEGIICIKKGQIKMIDDKLEDYRSVVDEIEGLEKPTQPRFGNNIKMPYHQALKWYDIVGASMVERMWYEQKQEKLDREEKVLDVKKEALSIKEESLNKLQDKLQKQKNDLLKSWGNFNIAKAEWASEKQERENQFAEKERQLTEKITEKEKQAHQLYDQQVDINRFISEMLSSGSNFKDYREMLISINQGLVLKKELEKDIGRLQENTRKLDKLEDKIINDINELLNPNIQALMLRLGFDGLNKNREIVEVLNVLPEEIREVIHAYAKQEYQKILTREVEKQREEKQIEFHKPTKTQSIKRSYGGPSL